MKKVYEAPVIKAVEIREEEDVITGSYMLPEMFGYIFE